MTLPITVECPRGMLWLTVAAPETTKTYTVLEDHSHHTLAPQTAPTLLNPGDVSSYWATAFGTTLLVKRDILCLRHPVSWKDEEIIFARDSLMTYSVLPCPLDTKGNRLVDVDSAMANVHVEVLEPIDVVAERIRAATPKTSDEISSDRFFKAFDKLVRGSMQRTLEDAGK